MRTESANDRAHWLSLIVLCAGTLMIVLDTTVVNVALPSIQRELHFSSAGLAWVMNTYLIAFGGLMLLAGRLGDLLSRRAVFLVGLVIFTGASLVCGLASSSAVLVAARFVQGNWIFFVNLPIGIVTAGLGGSGLPAALTGGYQLAFAVSAGLVVLAIVVTLALLRPERTSQRATESALEMSPAECKAAA